MKRLSSSVLLIRSGCMMALALTSCVAEVGAPDEVGEAPDPVVATVPGVPAWKAYIGAPRGRHARYGAASTRPDLVDEDAYVVLVPPPDGGPSQPIPLFLRQAWRYGDLYFERMTRQMGLTPLDWLGIQLAIADLEEHPKLLPSTHGLLVGPTFEEGTGGSPLPPPPLLPGDDHQGPGPTMGGGHAAGGGRPTPPHPPPPGPDDYTSPPPLPAVPPGMEHAAQDGIFPGDWPYAGWVPPNRPEDAGYTPQPGESKELIRCEGRIFLAYRNNCVDFQQKTPGAKWMAKIGGWSSSGRYLSTMTKADWTKLCEVLSVTTASLGCLAVIGGCVGTEAMTFGGVTLPCVWLTNLICLGHAAASSLIVSHCGEAVSLH